MSVQNTQLTHMAEQAAESLGMNGRALNERAIEVSPSSHRVSAHHLYRPELNCKANPARHQVLDRASGQTIPGAPPLIQPFPPSKNRPRPGDWTCPSCGFSNFQRRTACFRCSFPAQAAQAAADPYGGGYGMAPNPYGGGPGMYGQPNMMGPGMHGGGYGGMGGPGGKRTSARAPSLRWLANLLPQVAVEVCHSAQVIGNADVMVACTTISPRMLAVCAAVLHAMKQLSLPRAATIRTITDHSMDPARTCRWVPWRAALTAER